MSKLHVLQILTNNGTDKVAACRILGELDDEAEERFQR